MAMLKARQTANSSTSSEPSVPLTTPRHGWPSPSRHCRSSAYQCHLASIHGYIRVAWLPGISNCRKNTTPATTPLHCGACEVAKAILLCMWSFLTCWVETGAANASNQTAAVYSSLASVPQSPLQLLAPHPPVHTVRKHSLTERELNTSAGKAVSATFKHEPDPA
jgi:hypothetical protein